METPPDRARLTVTRNAPNDIGEGHLVVSLDGEKLGYLLHRQTLTREIDPGRHRRRVHNTSLRA